MTSERCQYCGQHYIDVYRVPDELWAKVVDKKQMNLLCPGCFSLIARNEGIPIYWECAKGEYPTEVRFATLRIEIRRLREVTNWIRDELLYRPDVWRNADGHMIMLVDEMDRRIANKVEKK